MRKPASTAILHWMLTSVNRTAAPKRGTSRNNLIASLPITV
jgi:hypothetical protein